MSTRLDLVLDAAFACFLRFGVRRTSMEDIAKEAGLSRSALYQHVRSKDDAFSQARARMLDRALSVARAAAEQPGPLAERVLAVLSVKLKLVVGMYEGSPHAAEILAENSRLDDGDPLHAGMYRLLVDLLRDLPDPAGRAALLLALTRGLEHDLTEPGRTERLLADGVRLLVPPTEPRGNTAWLDPKHPS